MGFKEGNQLRRVADRPSSSATVETCGVTPHRACSLWWRWLRHVLPDALEKRVHGSADGLGNLLTGGGIGTGCAGEDPGGKTHSHQRDESKQWHKKSTGTTGTRARTRLPKGMFGSPAPFDRLRAHGGAACPASAAALACADFAVAQALVGTSGGSIRFVMRRRQDVVDHRMRTTRIALVLVRVQNVLDDLQETYCVRPERVMPDPYCLEIGQFH